MDTSAPVITITGDSTINLLIGEPYYVEQGATAVDNIDGNVAVNISGVVYTSSPQNSPFTITYTATDAAGNTSTATRIVNIIEPTWSKLGNDIDGEAEQDNSGVVSLSSDGTRVAIGARKNDGTDLDSGHVRVYEWTGDTWSQLGNDIDGEAKRDNSGGYVSLSGDGTRVAIGAPWNDGNDVDSGHVRVYEWSGDTWTQLGNDIDGEAIWDDSGVVSLSSDGSIVAIGARSNDGGGFNSGHVRVYEWDNGTWNQLMLDIDGEAAEDSSGGWGNISLSGDGTRVAIGAPGNDGDDQSNAANEPGENYGHVRVYELPEEIKIKESDLFLASGNTSWPNVIPLTRIVDGSSSQLEQKLIINVTELPVGGAYYRIIFIRSGIDGNWIPTPWEPLTLGLNVITVPPDTYNRAIRVQFNNGAVKFNTLAVQKVLPNGYVLTGSVLFPGE